MELTGPTLTRAATFSHRQERALKDVNGRVNGLNKSQDHLSTAKSIADGRKVTRTLKQFSAVPSRYAAPLASKKNLSTNADKPQTGQANMTKLPFIPGRAAPSHQRKPSADSLNSSQPAMVFSASVREPKADTSAKKVAANSSSLGAKRPRVGTKTSMVEQKSQVAARAPRVYSLDKGGCWCSKNGSVRGPAEASAAGSVSVLYSAAHWVHLIKLAEGEKKNDVVVDLLRVAVRLKAEPREMVKVELKRYGEGHPSDEVVQQLVEECEGVAGVSVSSTTIEGGEEGESISEESNGSAAVLSNGDSGAACVSKITIVAPVVSENGGAVTKDVAAKRPHFMGRMLARSATFSVVDPNSKSVHAKAEYGRKLEKTLEFLASQAVAHSPEKAGLGIQSSQPKAQKRLLDCVPESEVVCESTTGSSIHEHVDAQISGELTSTVPSLCSSFLTTDELVTPSFKFVSSTAEVTTGAECIFAEASTHVKHSPLALEGASTPGHAVANGSAEMPVDSLSEWLDRDSSEVDTPDIQSTRTEENVDLSPNCRGAVQKMDVDSLMQEVVSLILPEDVSFSPSEPSAAQLSDSLSPVTSQERRESSQSAGNQSLMLVEEKVPRHHRHTLSADAVLLSVHCKGERSLLSVEDKVKLFSQLAVVGGVIPEATDAPVIASGGRQELTVVEESKVAAQVGEEGTETVLDESRQSESSAKTKPPEISIGAESTAQEERTTVQSEGPKALHTTPVRVSPRHKTSKVDAVPFSATPSFATPCEPASSGILRARHRRSSSVGNLTPRGPFDGIAACSPFGDNGGSPSSHSSSAKSKRSSRGFKEVTPRMNLPKPSWKAIVEREMKGSKLKELLAAQLPEEASPLSEYLEAQIGNQNRYPENGTCDAVDKCVSSTCSPAKLRRTTRSSARKQAAPKEEKHEVLEPKTVHKPRKIIEGEQGADSSAAGAPTPGSAMRRSARIQNKVQSKRNALFQEELGCGK
ncbi:uncharacterized protein [Physcomitrium patens]|uniref:uncharacterized protein isoform X2 n=1 Tax=Physcomitrium patens TaxID=3218 RepID=UPI000D175DDE|nr:uncharacterized protein LOC112275328 isoform X2 [Physcomitrium patens]|eukprot:XP_024361379.1 uncharacterized protein LOC112275328 isoform X2 [Physcomitrella patens]